MEPPYQRDGDAMQYLKASHAGIEPIHPSQIPEHARVMLAGNPDKIERLAGMLFPE